MLDTSYNAGNGSGKQYPGAALIRSTETSINARNKYLPQNMKNTSQLMPTPNSGGRFTLKKRKIFTIILKCLLVSKRKLRSLSPRDNIESGYITQQQHQQQQQQLNYPPVIPKNNNMFYHNNPAGAQMINHSDGEASFFSEEYVRPQQQQQYFVQPQMRSRGQSQNPYSRKFVRKN